MAHRQSTALKLAAVLLFALATGAFAQSPAAPPSSPAAQPQTASTPTLKVKTQLTIEDVTVTDDKGKSVHGLTESDFSVKEDAKPQAIKNFQEYSAQPPQAQQALPHLPPNVYTNQQATVPSAYNILYFDNMTSSGSVHRAPENLMVSKQETLKYLKSIPPGTEVAILVHADGLHIVQGFTSDRDLLLAAVNSIKPESVQGTYMPPLPPGIYSSAARTIGRLLRNTGNLHGDECAEPDDDGCAGPDCRLRRRDQGPKKSDMVHPRHSMADLCRVVQDHLHR